MEEQAGREEAWRARDRADEHELRADTADATL